MLVNSSLRAFQTITKLLTTLDKLNKILYNRSMKAVIIYKEVLDMEKTLAREIYTRMEIGRKYTTRELLNLIGDDIFFAHQPEFRGWDVYQNWDTIEQYQNYQSEIEMMRRRSITNELWQIVNAGYAATEVKDETYHVVKGLRYHVKNRDWSKVPTQTYTVRRWWRIK